MRVTFRQGIVSHESPNPFEPLNPTTSVSIVAGNRPLTVTIAHRDTNYIHSENSSVASAWTVSAGTDSWLYWDFNLLTFARTFGITTLAPIAQATEPTNPNNLDGQMWYDTANNIHYERSAGTWVEVLRVFAAKFISGALIGVAATGSSAWAGTQISDTTSVLAGRVLFDEASDTIIRDDRTLFTTEDQFFSAQSRVDAIRLESNVSRALSEDSLIAAYTVVAWTADGKVTAAKYNDVGSTVVGMLTEQIQYAGAGSPVLTASETGAVITQGTVTNPAWTWTDSVDVGSPLWVDNGLLVTIDPHLNDPTNPAYSVGQVPVARVLSIDTVIFEQGLGGKGDRGPVGPAGTAVSATTSSLGSVILVTDSSTPIAPQVISDLDPRLIDARVPSQPHADNVLVAGDTMTGLLVLSGDPDEADGAATKRYVDAVSSGLIWLDPVDKINLISDAESSPPVSPEDGDAYIMTATPGGVWAAPPVSAVEGDVVTYHLDDTSWHNNGPVSGFHTSPRFGVSFTSTTAASGANFVGHDNEIALFDGTGTLTGFEVPIPQNAVFIRNELSQHVYDQYVFNGTDWILFSASHDHERFASSITTTIYNTSPDWGTLTNTSDEITAIEVQTALEDITDGKAAKLPTYITQAHRPPAVNVEGMFVYVTDQDRAYVSDGVNWIPLVKEDDTISLPYDMAFHIAGSMQAENVVGSFQITRNVSIPVNATDSLSYAYTPASDGPYTINVYHYPSPTFTPALVGTVVFGIGLNAGVITWSTQINFVAGDLLRLETQSGTPDSTLEDISITFVGCAPTLQCTVA